MSTVAEKDKPAAKAPAPMGSFLGKLQDKAKPAPKPEEKPNESGENKNPVVAEKPVAAAPVQAEPVPKAETKPEAGSKTEPEKAERQTDKDTLEKRLKDTQSWANEEHKRALRAERELKELKEAVVRVEKKIDGTYEPPQLPSPEQQSADAQVRGRIESSHDAAVRQYGEEYVMQTVWAEDSLYQKLQANPLIRARVMEAKSPVLEAIAVVKEHLDGEKYGRTPEEIRKRIEEELKPKITQEILTSLKPKPGPVTSTLGNVRGDVDRTAQKADAPTRLDLKQVFPWGASRT
jgi:hypothetical protein